MPSATQATAAKEQQSKAAEAADIWDDDDFWQEMEVVKKDEPVYDLDDEDQKRYHYVAPKRATAANATGVFDDYDARGREWRHKQDQNEDDYTRLRVDEDDDTEEIHLRTKFLFDEDKAMTPLSQMQATKDLLTEAQRIAYVGVCYLTCREMAVSLRKVGRKELQPAIKNLELWSLKIMGRLYYHMEIMTAEQKMIATLAEHGVSAMDLVPPLMTTHTVANPEYDPAEAKRVAEEREDEEDEDGQTVTHMGLNDMSEPSGARTRDSVRLQTTANVLDPSTPVAVPGVSTHLSNLDENVTLDVRWTVLCDLFLVLIADSVYDSRSRVLLETVASKLGLGWSELVRFEKRVTDALEIEEAADTLDSTDVIESRKKAAKKKRYIMMGLATLGGGLVIGLSAGVLAPAIGAGLVTALTTIGVSGGTAVLTTTGGAAVITATGALTGGTIAVRGMARRTQHVRTFELLPMHNNKRVNCIITVPGFMAGPKDDVRLPFSVLDPIVGDVFSVRWEPEMMGETGNALTILTTEFLTGVSTTVLQYTVLTGLMSGLTWPLLLLKLGYLIDNPWSNALDRSKAAGQVLADVLMNRTLGVRPMTLIGFSLGARMIFYCLQELAKRKAYGIVQDVFLLGATVTAPVKQWTECRSVVAGRFVNGFARNDWILGYLYRATSGGLATVAGLRPVDNVHGVENVDLTDKIAGHLSYRSYMPLILDQLGFPVSADFFDEPEEMDEDKEIDREIGKEAIKDAERRRKLAMFARSKETAESRAAHLSGSTPSRSSTSSSLGDEGLPPRMSFDGTDSKVSSESTSTATEVKAKEEGESAIPAHAGFDLAALRVAAAEAKESMQKEDVQLAAEKATAKPAMPERTESAPPMNYTAQDPPSPTTPTAAAPYQTTYFTQSNPALSDTDGVAEIPGRFKSMSLVSSEAPPVPEKTSRSTSASSPSAPYGHFVYTDPSNQSYTGHKSPPLDNNPTLSFGNVDGSVWTPTPFSANAFGSSSVPKDPYSKSYSSNANDSTPNLNQSWGGVSASPSYSTNPFGSSSHSSNLAQNPFASSALSFGTEDGTISLGSTVSELDRWTPKPIGGSKKSTYTSNPWES